MVCSVQQPANRQVDHFRSKHYLEIIDRERCTEQGETKSQPNKRIKRKEDAHCAMSDCTFVRGVVVQFCLENLGMLRGKLLHLTKETIMMGC